MMKKYFLYTFGLFIICLCFSCDTEDCDRKEGEYSYLSDKEKIIVSYTGTDTLRFLHNSLDTLTFTGKGRNTYYNEALITKGNCPEKVSYYEGHRIVFSNVDSEDDIGISLYTQQFGFTNLNIKYKETYERSAMSMGSPYSIDSMTINGITYYNIDLIPTKYHEGAKIYYNETHGILKIEALNDTLTLLP